VATSEAQLAANRGNAAKSTGPPTPEGKARSRGLTASTFAVVSLQDLHLKAVQPELPNEPILEAQPEQKKSTYAPSDEPISTPHTLCDPGNPSGVGRSVDKSCRRTIRMFPAPQNPALLLDRPFCLQRDFPARQGLY
jgi:hypothetical protein